MKFDARLRIALHEFWVKHDRQIISVVIIWLIVIIVNQVLKGKVIEKELTNTYTPDVAIITDDQVPKKKQDIIKKMKRQVRVNAPQHTATKHYVDNYGYMGDLQQVLGSTGAEQLVQVYPGYGTIGSIVNASLMLDHAVTQSQVYEDMNGTTISDDGLQQLLQNYFPASSPAIYDDIEEALDDQCVIIVRVNMNSITSNIPNHVISGDYNVVDYNPVRHRYVCFDSVSKQIKVLDKDLIDNGVISARFYIITR